MRFYVTHSAGLTSRAFSMVIGAVAALAACDGETTRGGRTGDSSGGGGSSLAGSCDDYLGCVAAASPESLGEALATYGQDGSCWKDLPRSTCEEACADAFHSLAEDNPTEPACGGTTPIVPELHAGLHFLSLTPAQSSHKPFPFLVDVQRSGDNHSFTLQPIDADDRRTINARPI